MRRASKLLGISILAAGVCAPRAGLAAGLLIPTDNAAAPLVIRSQRVRVEITDTLATTEIEQVFSNRESRALEAVYVFPLPEGASVSAFSMWVAGNEVRGEVMEKGTARSHYDRITRARRDPALLEHLRGNTFRISVSPVPALGEQRVRLVYSQTLPYRRGVLRYEYPLQTSLAAPTELEEELTLTVRVSTHAPVLHVYSPTHPVDVLRGDDGSVLVGLEEPKSALDRDFSLLVSLKEKRSGVTVVTYRHSPEEDGYFLALVTAPEDAAKEPLAKDVVFVLDTSGSMRGGRIAQAKEALLYCIEKLDARDRFNVIRFSTGVERLSTGLVAADAEKKADARRFVESFRAAGGTNISGAISAALEAETAPPRPAMLLFLTDGTPTVGETSAEAILKHLAARKEARARFPRIYVFGVGSDVNRKLLEGIAELSAGGSVYVEPGEGIGEEVADLFDRIRSPVMSDLALATPGLNAHDVFPAKLPPLYAGRQLVVTGRYKAGGPAAVRVTAKGTEDEVVLAEETDFPREASREASHLPRLWATRKIGELRRAIRRNGRRPELVEEIVRLSKRHGVMTQYTSYLVLESEKMYRERGIARARRRADGLTASAARRARGPIIAHEEVEVADHFETDNDMDQGTARGREDAISDIPLGGTGVVAYFGVGGGGAGCFGYRYGGGRKKCVARFGGSAATERAVEAALRWLAHHQEPDGRWDPEKCEGGNADPAATGLATLAFLSAGYTQSVGKFKTTVSKAVAWLISRQDDDGCIGGGFEGGLGYHHAICGLALAEDYGMTRIQRVGRAAQKAVEYSILRHQREYSGWGRRPREAPNTSVTGWFAVQLKSAKIAGLEVEGRGFQGAINWLDRVTTKPGVEDPYGGRVSYQEYREPMVAMTALGMLARQIMGWDRTDPLLQGGARRLMASLPDREFPDFFYWCCGTLAMFQMGGGLWEEWNVALKDVLLKAQRAGGDEDGSWDPAGPEFVPGGRVFSTAMGTLCLEVYYRYLPIYK